MVRGEKRRLSRFLPSEDGAVKLWPLDLGGEVSVRSWQVPQPEDPVRPLWPSLVKRRESREFQREGME